MKIASVVGAFAFCISLNSRATVARVWHGVVPNAKANEYKAYIGEAVKKFTTIKGNQGYQLMSEAVGSETHFMVVSYWDSKKSIEAYAGSDIRKTHFLPRDKEFLVNPEDTVKNYEIISESGPTAPTSTKK